MGSRTGEGGWKKIKEMPALIRDISKLNCVSEHANVMCKSTGFISVIQSQLFMITVSLCLWGSYFYHRFILFMCVKYSWVEHISFLLSHDRIYKHKCLHFHMFLFTAHSRFTFHE